MLPKIDTNNNNSPSEYKPIERKLGINCMNGLGITREKSIAATIATSQAVIGP